MFSFLYRWFGKKTTARSAYREDVAAFQQLEQLVPRIDAEEAEQEGRIAAGDRIMCREAILDRTQRVVGYQFMLRSSVIQRIRASGPRIRRLYDQVLTAHLRQLELGRLLGGRFALIEVTATELLDPAIETLPLASLIVIIAADSLAGVDEQQRARMIELRKKGLRLGLVINTLDDPAVQSLMELMAVGILDVLDPSQPPLAPLGTLFSLWPEMTLLVRNIEAYDTFELCHRWQHQMYFVSWFQGTFITRREAWTQPSVEPGKLTILQLLKKVRQGVEAKELALTLRLDSALVYRLLRYVNSPAGGLLSPVSSIENALLVLGRDKLIRWLAILLFGSGENSAREMSLLDNALIRGRLAETLAQGKLSRQDQENLFLVGLFSLLDCLLRLPMEQALEQLGLPAAVEAALLRGQGPYAPWLQLAQAVDDEQGGDIEALAQTCGLQTEQVNLRHMEAIVWAQEVVN